MIGCQVGRSEACDLRDTVDKQYYNGREGITTAGKRVFKK